MRADSSRAGRVQRGEAHGVGVEFQPLAPVQDDVLVHVERHGHAPEQRQRARAPDARDERFGSRRVDRFWLLARQAEYDGLDAAVAVARGPERAEQLHPDPVDPAVGSTGEQAVCFERAGEHEGGAHRADRV